MSEAIESKIAAWTQAISAEAFCGELARYDEDFQQLQTEIQKLKSVHDETCNWNTVYESADRLLRTKTKDMTVLGALCIALFKREGFAGLAAGLGSYVSLIQQHLMEIYPKPNRRRGRAGAFTWLTEQLTAELEQAEPGPADHEEIQTTLQYFEQLDGVMVEQLGDLHPRVGPIKTMLGDFVERSRPAPPAPPEPEPAPWEAQGDTVGSAGDGADAEEAAAPPAEAPPRRTAPQRAAGGGGLPTSIESEEQAASVLESVRATLRALGTFYLKRDEQNPLGYQLAHFASFLGVVPGGEHKPPVVDQERMDLIASEFADQSWRWVIKRALLVAKESGINTDVEYYLERACGELGYDQAQATVKALVLGTAAAFGEDLDLREETALWVRQLGGSASALPAPPSKAAEPSGPPEGGEGEDGSPEEDRLSQQIAAAGALVASDGLEAGFRLIQGELASAGSKQIRFHLRLALAALCVQENAADLARPILQELLKELEDPISSWEPAILVRVAQTVLACNRQLEEFIGQGADPELEAESARMMTTLARIDPGAALAERQRG
jgi:type VI secretion system ImpA/VasJ family protein